MWDNWRIQQFDHPTGFHYLFPSCATLLRDLQGGLCSASFWLSGSQLHGRKRLLLWCFLSAVQEVWKENQVEIHGERRSCTFFPNASSLKQGNLSMGHRSRRGDGRALGEVQPPHSGQKREFCGCPIAVTGWDARKA